MANPIATRLGRVGQIETQLQRIADIERRVQQLPLWRPGAVLARQAREARKLVLGMQDRLEGHLVATLIGPSGAGKSTLFNALIGQDDLSPAGETRPTTRDLVILGRDARTPRRMFPGVDHNRVIVLKHQHAPDHLILVDTPDTDSTESPEHLELLKAVVARSDVLICVFDAQNPKRKDHADFMAALVRHFSGASLVAVVNKVDRQDAQELDSVIGPDFLEFLDNAWQTRPETVLLVSARSHLQDPQWDEKARPRHDLDQFEALKTLVMETFNQPGAGRDRRVANAARIGDYLDDAIRTAATEHAASLREAIAALSTAETQAFQAALAVLRAEDRRQMVGVNVRLYQALAQRWLGPVGWLVAVWSRLIVFGSGLTALVRFGNPIRQLWGAVASWRRLKRSRSALDMLQDSTRVDAAMGQFRKTFAGRWPDIAALLVAGGFNPDVRRLGAATPDHDAVGQALDQLWADALDAQIVKYASGLSHFMLQGLLNLPAIGLMGYVGWLTAWGFFNGNYLSSDFFLHAVLTIVIVLLLSFFLLQGIVRLSVGKDRIQRNAFAAIQTAAPRDGLSTTRDIKQQLDAVIALAEDRF